MSQRGALTAGELSQKVQADTTIYNALEVGHAMADDIGEQLYESARKHATIIDEPEYCVVMIIAKDPLIKNLIRRKFYCWPYYLSLDQTKQYSYTTKQKTK